MKNSILSIVGIFVALGFDAYGCICIFFYKVNQRFGDIMCVPVSIIATVFFAVWAAKITGGGGLLRNKKVRNKFIFTALGENIPLIKSLPLWTFFAVSQIIKGSKDNTIIIKDTNSDDESEKDDNENNFEEDHAEEELEEENPESGKTD